MKSVKVSVIVPIYNAEAFKNNLIILCSQTLEDIEYVMVNDASTDNSLEMLYELERNFPNKVVVINSAKNKGPGGARNIGILHAKGEYIGFMDQDDLVLDNMFEDMYNYGVSGNYHIVSCGYYNKKYEEYWSPYKLQGDIDVDGKIALCNDVLYIWNKIYKRELIDSMSMLFRENVINDDVDFCIEAYLRADRMGYINKMLYYYNYEGTTLSRPEKNNLNRYIDQTFKLFTAVKDRIISVGMEDRLRDICHNFAVIYLRSLLFALFSIDAFSYSLFEVFHDAACILMPDYYTIKSEKNDLVYVIFNCLEKDKAKSYENLVALKEKILNG